MTKVCLWGLGAMGRGVAALLLERGHSVVAAISHQVGEDVGEILGRGPLGVTVAAGPGDVTAVADVCVIATHTSVAQVHPQILWAVGRGMHVVTSAEEMFNAAVEQPALAGEIDAAARAAGVSVIGTGVNPGFAMDTMVAFLSTACRRVDTVEVTRVNDISPFGQVVVEAFGLGLTPAEFETRAADGRVVGHVGFRGSIALIAEACDLALDEIVEWKAPIVTDAPRATPFGFTIEAGHVVGCNQIGEGRSAGRTVVRLEHPQQVYPEAGGTQTGDTVRIEGDPPLHLRIEPEIAGGAATVAVLTNVIPRLLEAPPGLVTMADLRLPTLSGRPAAKGSR